MARFDELVRRSIQKDFARANFKRMGIKMKKPHPKNVKRVIEVNKNCDYFPYRKFILGKLVRVLEEQNNSVLIEFVNNKDREILNNAAGWSDMKRSYLLNRVKFDD